MDEIQPQPSVEPLILVKPPRKPILIIASYIVICIQMLSWIIFAFFYFHPTGTGDGIGMAIGYVITSYILYGLVFILVITYIVGVAIFFNLEKVFLKKLLGITLVCSLPIMVSMWLFSDCLLAWDGNVKNPPKCSGYYLLYGREWRWNDELIPPPSDLPTQVSPTPVLSSEPSSIILPSKNKNGWQTYQSLKYNFSFDFPAGIYAFDADDKTNGQIPDVAGFGYRMPNQYELGNIPANKMGIARILIWENVEQDLGAWIRDKGDANNLEITKIGGYDGFYVYTKNENSPEGRPTVFKAYYLKVDGKIIQIMGFSEINPYSDKWIVDFDEIVLTLRFN